MIMLSKICIRVLSECVQNRSIGRSLSMVIVMPVLWIDMNHHLQRTID
jgi:hypothetical protein